MSTSAATRRRNLEYKHRRRLARIAAGLCTLCGVNPVGSTRLCAPCSAKESDRFGKLVAARILAGRCVWCGREPLQTRTRCAPCAGRHRTRNVERWRRIAAEKKAVTA